MLMFPVIRNLVSVLWSNDQIILALLFKNKNKTLSSSQVLCDLPC